MEKEIADLRSRLSHPNQEQTGESHVGDDLSQCSEEVFARRGSATIERSRPVSVPVEPHPAMATPLTMQRDGSILSQEENHWRLEDVSLSRARVSRLFEQYELHVFDSCALFFLTHPQILYVLSSFPSASQSPQTRRGVSESMPFAGMDHHLRCQPTVSI